MSSTGVGPAPDDGAGSRRYLLVSDFHLGWEPDEADAVLETIEQYGTEHDCDGLVVGGDLDATDGEFSDLLDLDFERTMVALGNHDTNGSGPGTGSDPDADLQVDEQLYWEEALDETVYSFGMTHDPGAYNINAHTDDAGQKTPTETDVDVRFYGHSHMPYDRVIDDTLYVGLGSTYQNYNTDDAVMPDASFHLLEVDDDRLSLRHYDFETGDLIEETIYSRDDDRLELESAVWTWPREREERWA